MFAARVGGKAAAAEGAQRDSAEARSAREQIASPSSLADRFSALRCCHAAPVRDARLRSVSSKIRSHCVGLGLLLSLRSIRAAHDGSALLL